MNVANQPIEDSLLYTVGELSEASRIPKRTIYKSIENQTLGVVRGIGVLKIEGREFKRWVRAHYRGALVNG